MRKHHALVIHPDAQLRNSLVGCLKEAGYDAHAAAGRRDGLQLLYRTHPHVVLLSVGSDPRVGLDLLAEIRLFTETPAILVAEHAAPGECPDAGIPPLAGLVGPSPGPALVACVDKAVGRKVRRPPHSGESDGARDSSCLPVLRCLSWPQVLHIDRALDGVVDGEVRLIKHRGRLRFIARVKTDPYVPVST